MHMKKMTEQNLRAAFAGESQAAMKYRLFSLKAEKEGKTNVSRLFRAIAYAEQIHASNHLKTLGELKKSDENLVKAIAGETYEVTEMYPAFKAVSEEQEESRATKSFNWAFQAEKIHIDMYTKAKEVVDQDKDPEIGKLFICDLCGHTVEGERPDKCPICGADSKFYREF